MNERTFSDDNLSVETVIADEKLKLEVRGEYCRLNNALIDLRKEHDKKVALIEKETNLTALGLMETARRKVVQGFDKFIDDDNLDKDFRAFMRDEQYNLMVRMTWLFRDCVDFPKPKKLKKATS